MDEILGMYHLASTHPLIHLVGNSSNGGCVSKNFVGDSYGIAHCSNNTSDAQKMLLVILQIVCL